MDFGTISWRELKDIFFFLFACHFLFRLSCLGLDAWRFLRLSLYSHDSSFDLWLLSNALGAVFLIFALLVAVLNIYDFQFGAQIGDPWAVVVIELFGALQAFHKLQLLNR